MKRKHITTLLACLGMTAVLQTAYAGNITDINVSSLPDEQKIIKIRFDRDVVLPSGFISGTPTRIALDFADTRILLPQSVLEYADPLLNQITAAQNSNRARIVLGLNKTAQYTAEIRDEEVWVYISETADQNTASVSPPENTPYRPAETAHIDFRKGSGGSGIVELDISGFDGTPDIKEQRDRVIITLNNHAMPTQAQRSLDVGDFNTPVRNITLKRMGNATRLTILNNGLWEMKTRSAAGRYSFEIRPKSAEAFTDGTNSLTAKSFKGRKLSLDFQNIEVRTILQILAKESGMNIIASDSVGGKMTLSLKDVPWDQALDLVMQARNLDMRRQGNIINIAPREELLAKDKAFLQAEKEIAELGPLYSQTFQLKYKNVEEFRKILRLDERSSNSSSGGNRNTLLSPRGSALIDSGTNTLIVTDTRSVIEKFRKLIDELDVAARQVMVEARIVEAEDGFSRDLGLKFGYSGNRSGGNTAWGSTWNGGTALGSSPNINLPVAAATSSVALVRSLSSGALGLELSASEAQKKTKTISNPRVLTQDRQEASIESGQEIPYQESSSSGATSVTFKKAVLGLTVTPNITPDGQIIMNVKINRDTPVACQTDGVQTLCISTKNLTTQAMVEDGGTLIIGGIYEESSGNSINKVPLLGDIPVIGNLFKSRARSEERKELLVFITPRIMDGQGNNLRY
ncbi:type IV pilus secretin PilQ [Neisseria animalis]|uniref:Type IV pilus biogenesis and competence protein PilQ n=1 Tax=Neisseria animalis TaxID=492 RepID=A0A5P3MRN1_NEIAN|nr:type IV pilus secretin PilQ [Neisseria animalis]QEY24267.1 type IV pilus secretin PilQ [Neisseria animalis]ROW32327.1 type IV pilus secretin PilQ [Neisseria animalis]VEE06655.1 PilQ [Neisseria animalis]